VKTPSFASYAALAVCGVLLAACQTANTPRLDADPAPAAAEASAPPTATVTVDAAPAPAASARSRCVPRNLPRAPKYPDTDAALRDAGGAADRYQLMAAGRLLRMRRLADLEKAIDACR
jgi:hypothetical protein